MRVMSSKLSRCMYVYTYIFPTLLNDVGLRSDENTWRGRVRMKQALHT